MNEYVIQGATLYAIADAIRAKKTVASDYTRVEYIESTGTQYINTRYKFTSDKVKIRMGIENMNTAAGAALCGTENASYSGSTSDQNGWFSPLLFSYVADGANIFTLNIGGTPYATKVTIPKNAQHTVEVETFGNGAGQTVFDGTVTNYSYSGHMENLYDLYLFAENYTGKAQSFSKYRLYSFQIYDNDVLVRDFVPCVHTDGTVGLYDSVTKEFYTNAGSGVFTAGAEIEAIDGTTGSDDLIRTSSMAYEILTIGQASEKLPLSIKLENNVLIIE